MFCSTTGTAFADEADRVTDATASQMKVNRSPTPSVAEPRRHLLLAVRSFVRSARNCPGVLRIVLLGSLTTTKLIPKDVDVLVTIDGEAELVELARAGRRLQGGSNRQPWCRHFSCQRRWVLRRLHLPLSQVLSTRDMYRAKLRPSRAPQRRSSGRLTLERADCRAPSHPLA